MTKQRDRQRQSMKEFWNGKAKDNAPFYIATWRGYDRTDLEDFFLSGEQATPFVRDSGYQPTGRDSMLEIGCGIGRMTHGFAQLFGDVRAIDVSGEMIDRAQSLLGHIPNICFYETDGTDLALFTDGSIDFCFSYIVFQHIPSKAIVFNYIREAARVLKASGIFHFQVRGLPDPDVSVAPALVATKKIYRRWVRSPFLTVRRRLSGGPRGFESSAWLGVSFSPGEITDACQQAGLTVLRITGVDTDYMWVTAVMDCTPRTEPQSKSTFVP